MLDKGEKQTWNEQAKNLCSCHITGKLYNFLTEITSSLKTVAKYNIDIEWGCFSGILR